MCFSGFRVTRPSSFAVESPKCSATYPWAASWKVIAMITRMASKRILFRNSRLILYSSQRGVQRRGCRRTRVDFGKRHSPRAGRLTIWAAIVNFAIILWHVDTEEGGGHEGFGHDGASGLRRERGPVPGSRAAPIPGAGPALLCAHRGQGCAGGG